MRLLTKPSLTHKEILESCTNNILDNSLKENVQKELEFFKLSSEEYDKKASLGELSKIPMHDNVNDSITKDEMKFLYNKLITKGIPARDYYDTILHGARLCPFCGCRPSKTLDHYLPKAKFPTYAVDPLNLIPCCRDCNSEKRVDVPTKEAETLHPYYDSVDGERWLYAEIEEVKEVGFTFFVVKPPKWSTETFIKVQYHFTTFKLSDIFSILASEELGDQAYSLKELFNHGGQHGQQLVKEQLMDFHISSQKHHLNHWKSAMFEALALSEWFCSEGIRNYST